jgi:CheY-like chemotaxis protein
MMTFMNEDTHTSPQTILIADDNKVMIRLTKELLTRAGYQVAAVSSGDQALQAASNIQPDLILLDVDMPGVSGFETCRAIKQNPLPATSPSCSSPPAPTGKISSAGLPPAVRTTSLNHSPGKNCWPGYGPTSPCARRSRSYRQV